VQAAFARLRYGPRVVRRSKPPVPSPLETAPGTTTPLPSTRSGLSAEELADYLADIGGTLVAYGCPSYRLEEVIASVGEGEDYSAQAFAFPTGLFISLRASRSTPPLLRMVRVKQWQTNLDRLVLVDAIFNDVADRKLSIREARKQLADIDRRPLPYPRALEWIAVATASASDSSRSSSAGSSRRRSQVWLHARIPGRRARSSCSPASSRSSPA